MNPQRKSQLALILGCALALSLRLYQLSAGPLNLDEGYTVLAARSSLLSLFLNGPCDGNPPGSFLPYSIWFRVIGSNRISAEMLSVIFGVASLVLMFLLAEKMFSQGVAIKLLFLGAVSKYHLLFSQYVRIYSIAVFGLLFAALVLVDLRLHPKKWKTVLFLFVSFAVVNLHYYAAFVVFSILLSISFCSGHDGQIRSFARRAVAIVGLLFVPTIVWQAQVINRIHRQSWIDPIDIETLASIWYHLSSESIILLIVFLSLIASGLRNGLSRPNIKPQLMMLLWWLFAPLGIASLFSIAGGSILHVRYFIFCLPPFLMLVANGWELLPSRTARFVTGCVIATASASSIQSYFHGAAKLEKDSEIYRTIAANYRTGDAVLSTSKCSFVSSVYAHEFLFPEYIVTEASSRVLRCTMGNPPEKNLFDQSGLLRLWVVNTDCYPSRASHREISLPELELITSHSFPNGTLSLYQLSSKETPAHKRSLSIIPFPGQEVGSVNF